MSRKLVALIDTGWIPGALRVLARRLIKPRLRCWPSCRHFVEGKRGLEIGGPSFVFARSNLFPVYPIADHIDNCNFSRRTVWEGSIEEGTTFRYDEDQAPGRQYIGEASSLDAIGPSTYDFVLSSHTLEHLANPLGALSEWKRVLKPAGVLVLVVPHREGTFDHRRPVTTLAHLIKDFEQQTPESDMTHLEEILELHDLARDRGAGDFEAFRIRSERNYENRCLHHHVFDTALAVEMVHYLGLQIRAVEPVRPYHIFILAQKVECTPENERFRGSRPAYTRRSPFLSDRRASRLPAS